MSNQQPPAAKETARIDKMKELTMLYFNIKLTE